MADKAIHEMISAFASGCMDKKNHIQFRDYVLREGDMPAGELGEFLNIMSLIPSILEIEKPDKEVKERVAKKLLSYQDEIQEKIKKQRTKTFTKEEFPDPKNKNVHSLNELDPKDVKELTNDELVKFNTLVSEVDDDPATNNNVEPQPQIAMERIAPVKQPEPVGKINSKLPWIILTVMIILFAVIFYILSNINSNLENDISTLKNQVLKLQDKVDNANIFISENRTLIEFLNNRDLVIIDLLGSDLAPDAAGKFIMSFFDREGLISFNNLPALESGMVYSLWLVSRGQSYLLGSYGQQRETKYFSVKDIPPIPLSDIDLIRVTAEKQGDTIAKGNTVLYGAIYKGQLK